MRLVSPCFVVGGLLLALVLPRTAAFGDLRMAVHIVMFAAGRDAMLPSRMWAIGLDPVMTTFKCSTATLWLLAAYCALASTWILEFEPALEFNSDSGPLVLQLLPASVAGWATFLTATAIGVVVTLTATAALSVTDGSSGRSVLSASVASAKAVKSWRGATLVAFCIVGNL